MNNAMQIKNEKFVAPADLAPYVSGMWITRSEGPEDEMTPVQCCLPIDAWELIFHGTSQRLEIFVDGQAVSMPEMAGFATKGQPVYWQVAGGAFLFGVILLPEAMELLTDRRPSELREKRFEDLRVYGQPIFETLLQAGCSATTFEGVADAVFSALRTFFRQVDPEKLMPYFAGAMRLIRTNPEEMPSLDNLSEQLYVCKRQLQRTFIDKLGFGPKAYSRMLRFSNAIHYLSAFPDAKMTEVAYDFGYADQSHFIREFRDFTGCNPKSFFSCWKPVAISSHRVAV